MTNPFSKLAELQARARAMTSSVIVPSGNGRATDPVALALARVSTISRPFLDRRIDCRRKAPKPSVRPHASGRSRCAARLFEVPLTGGGRHAKGRSGCAERALARQDGEGRVFCCLRRW
jgi:hypothetical protein